MICNLVSELYRSKFIGFSVDDISSVLDVGCGCGFGSRMWSPIAKEVFAFDLGREGIDIARLKWSHLGNLHFFVGDGIYPDRITELKGRIFDLCLIREFLPFTRYLKVEGKPVNHRQLLMKYMDFLRPGGLCIIWHHLRRYRWETEGLLKFNEISNEYLNVYGPVDPHLYYHFPAGKGSIPRAFSRLTFFDFIKFACVVSKITWLTSRKPFKLIAIVK